MLLLKKLISIIKYALFFSLTYGFLIVMFFLLPLLIILPVATRLKLLRPWSDFTRLALKTIYGLNHKVSGLDNINPNEPSIVMANHQSPWETIMLQKIFPDLTWVLKKELLRIPIFGQLLFILQPIHIDRKKGSKAMKTLLAKGQKKLKQGFWILIFPEGTRQVPNKLGKFKLGGAQLAVKLQVPIYAVAHNSGEFWRKNQLDKNKGTIEVKISPRISPANKTALELNQEVRDWIKSNYPSNLNKD